MNKAEVSKVMIYLFADFDQAISEAKLNVWFEQFKHLPYEVAWNAANLLLNRKMYGPPKVYDFKEAVKEITANAEERLEGHEAFAMAVAAVQRFGSYNEIEGLASLPPLVARITKQIGWKNICMCEDLSLIRGHFVKAYEAIADREADLRTLSPRLQAALTDSKPGGAWIGDIMPKLIDASKPKEAA